MSGMGAREYRAQERNAMHTSQSCGKVLEYEPWKLKIIDPSPSLEHVVWKYASKGGHQADVHENVIYPFAFHPRETVQRKKQKMEIGDYLFMPFVLGILGVAFFGGAVGYVTSTIEYACPDKIEGRHP